ncbi:MAG: hypothetical protein HZA50_07060 [Planctomycetes bacterium]|nr:hypothetical protein [Planctomycetota bacterium]
MYRTRIKIFMGIVALVILTIIVRVGYLQFVKGDEYRIEAQNSLQRVEFLPTARGKIIDREGNILARDESCHDLCLDYRLLTSDERWLKKQRAEIARTAGVDKDEAGKLLQQRIDNTWSVAAQVAKAYGADLQRKIWQIKDRVEQMRLEVGADVREQSMAHPVISGLEEPAVIEIKSKIADGRGRPLTIGLELAPSKKRYYPYNALACHIIGVLGPVARADQLRDNLQPDQADWLTRMTVNYLDNDQRGISGVEGECEKTLRGVRGYRTFKNQNVQETEEKAVDGRDVRLTIDMKLQDFTTALLRSTHKNGAAVVIDVRTGQILAMVSVPIYDLNRYREDYRILADDFADSPLRSRAVQALYPPGSSMKAATALAALADGAIRPDTVFTCDKYLLPGKDYFRCLGHHGELDLVGGIRKSCNIYFYRTGEAEGADRLCQWFRKFGFGSRPGTGLPEEVAGLVPTEHWLRQTRHGRLSAGDARNMAIGQGLITVSPLQVANAMATIARGSFLSPAIVLDGGPEQNAYELPLPAEYWSAVRRGMYEVVNVKGGTAYEAIHSAAILLGVEMCGKTGTAQTPDLWRDLNNNNRKDADEIIRTGSTAWFAGFAPYKNPQVAFAVVLEYVDYESEGGGGKNAGPLAARIVQACLTRGHISRDAR